MQPQSEQNTHDCDLLSTPFPPDLAPAMTTCTYRHLFAPPSASLLTSYCTYLRPTHRETKKNKNSFNRSEEDFNGDLRAYNDYLETMEDIIYGLCSGDKKEAEQAQARVREYEDGHRGEITKNAAKK